MDNLLPTYLNLPYIAFKLKQILRKLKPLQNLSAMNLMYVYTALPKSKRIKAAWKLINSGCLKSKYHTKTFHNDFLPFDFIDIFIIKIKHLAECFLS